MARAIACITCGDMRRGAEVVVLLAGGDKQTQDEDIARAIDVAKDWKD